MQAMVWREEKGSSHPLLASPPAPLQGERGVVCLVCCTFVTGKLVICQPHPPAPTSLTPSPYQPHPPPHPASPPAPLSLTPNPSPRGEGEWYALCIGCLLFSTYLLVSWCYVHFSAKVLTLWLRFFPPIDYLVANNRFSWRFVLRKIGGSWKCRRNEFLFNKMVVCTRFGDVCC